MTAYVPGTEEKDLSKFALSLQQLAAGRSNATGTVTLSAGTLTVVNTRTGICAPESVPWLVPRSSAAEAIHWWITSVGRDTFTIGTSAAAGTEAFLYVVIG